MRKPVFVSLLLFLAVLLISGAAQAQTAASASITGRVTDPQGAVVTNATVTATNVATGATRTAQTTSNGLYNIPNLQPGDYNVTVVAAGFAKGIANAIHLNVGDAQDVNFGLKLGGATTTVEVSGEAPLIETTKTEVSTSITAVDMTRLPVLSGGTGVSNDYAQLALSAPGVHSDTSGNTGNGVGGNGDLVAPGAFNYRGNLYNVDGANIVDQVVSGRDAIGASVDEIQEFQVVTNNYNAEYGQAGGLILNAVTKSGSNGVHGEGHMFFRGRNLASSSPFYNLGLFAGATPRSAGGACPDSDFAGGVLTTVSGCDRAPFHKKEGGFTLGGPFIKNKLFWFAAFENTRQGFPATLTPGIIPNVTVQQPWNELLSSGRLDWVVSSKHTLMARYAVQRDKEGNQVVQTGNNITPDSLVNIIFHDTVLNVGLVSTLTPHTTNEARFMRHQFKQSIPDDTTVPGQAHNTYYTGADFCCPQGGDQKRYQYIDNLTWTRGAHTVKTGYNISYYPYYSLFQQFHYGQYTSFDNTDTIPGEFDLGLGPGAVTTKDNIYGFYVQDSWKLFHNFTVNYGLRYDVEAGGLKGGTVNHSGSHCLQANGLVPACSSDYNNFQPRLGIAWQLSKGTLLHAGFGEITELAYNNIGLDSLNFDGVTLNTAVIVGGTPASDAVLAFYPNFPSQAALAPFVGNLCPSTSSGGCGRTRPISSNLKDPEVRHLNLGIEHQFGSSVAAEVSYVGAYGFGMFGERDLNARQVIADPNNPGYFYWGARPLYQIGNLDSCVDGFGNTVTNCLPASQFTNVRTQENSRKSSYNGLVASVTKRLSHHVAFQAGYAWSHTLTSGEDFYGLSEPGDARNPGAEKGPAYNDIRHAFNFGANFDTARLISGNWLTGTLVNNWIFGFVGQFQSGRPYPISTGVGEYSGGRFFGIGSETNQRPSVLPDGTIVATNISSRGGNLALDSNGAAQCTALGFGTCPTTTFLAPAGASTRGALDSFSGDVVDFQLPSGNLQRNAGLGSPFARLDVSVKKLFHPVSSNERLEVELVGQFFNIFNHPNWQGFNSNDVTSFLSIGNPGCGADSTTPGARPCIDPLDGRYYGANGHVLHIQDLQHGKLDKNLGSPNFGGLGNPAAVELPRTIQLSLRVRF